MLWRKIMEIDIAYLIILVAVGHLAFYQGHQSGISKTLDYMKDQGKIDFDE
jgi:hypothetical protein